MKIPLLEDFVIIALLGIIVILICSRLRLPSLVGFLITGAIAGPHGLRWLNNLHEVEVLAEIGVIFLLFTVGLELSLGHLLRMKRFVIGAGALQAAGTMLVTFVLMALLSLPYHEAVLIACLVTLSSTAVVLKLLQERGELERPYGRATLGILIFQDFLIIPLMLLLPFLAGESEGGLSSIGLTLLKAAGFVTGVMVAARYVVPKLLFIIVKAKSQELFLVSVAGLCFAVAILAQEVGLSLALGALFAGIIISESEYSNEAFSRIQPFRDVFASLFFVSVGMLIDLSFVVEYPLEIFASFLILIALKIVLAASANVAVGLPLRSALLSGIALAQLGEFSFLLSKEARVLELISEFNYQIFLSCSVLTIASTPFFLRGAPALVDWFLGRSIFQGTIFRALRHELEEEAVSARDIEDHLIIVGFGLNGRNVAKAAENASIPYVISELNPDTVRTERKLGRRIFFGDSAQEDVLKRLGIQRARVLVAAVSEPIATRRIVALARKLNPSIYIIARTRLVAETVPLYKEGANEVVPEEYETSVEIFARVLANYLVPKETIERMVRELRSDGYQMFRNLSNDSTSVSNIGLYLPDIEIVTLLVKAGSRVEERSVAELELRAKFGITLLAIRRGAQLHSNPSSDTRLKAADALLVLGSPEQCAEFSRVCEAQ